MTSARSTCKTAFSIDLLNIDYVYMCTKNMIIFNNQIMGLIVKQCLHLSREKLVYMSFPLYKLFPKNCDYFSYRLIIHLPYFTAQMID